MRRDRTAEVRRALGANVRRERERAALTQEELAERAGLTWLTVHRLEAGQTARLATIVGVADALRVPVASLFRER